MVIVRYKVGTDLEAALVRLNQKLQTNFDRIPSGVSFPMIKPRSIDDVPVLALTLHSAKYDHLTLRRFAAQVDDAMLAQELTRLGQLLAPAQRLLRGAADAGLAVIVYHEHLKGGDALTRHLAAAMQGEEPLVTENRQSIEGAYDGVVYSNGNGDLSEER